MLAAEHALQLHQFDAARSSVQTGDHLLVGVLVVLLNRHVEQHAGILKIGEILLPDADQILQLAQLALHPLGLVLVVPEIGADGLPFQQFNLFPLAV
jgi:hypothetical protein